jgi:hypothetical protein
MQSVEVYQGNSPDNGGSNDRQLIGKLLPDYTTQQPKRQPSSYWLHENLRSYKIKWTPATDTIVANKHCKSQIMGFKDTIPSLTLFNVAYTHAAHIMCK